MDLDLQIIGHRVKQFREKNHLSQLCLAELVDKSTPYISYIETGKKCMSLETFVRIANALQISTDLLLTGQLFNSSIVASQEITVLLEDCTNYEELIIVDTIKSLKSSLREHVKVNNLPQY